MNKIVYIGTDKWSIQLSQLCTSTEVSVIHAVIPLGSQSLKKVCLNEGVTYSEVKNVNNLKSFLSTLDFDLFVVVEEP